MNECTDLEKIPQCCVEIVVTCIVKLGWLKIKGESGGSIPTCAIALEAWHHCQGCCTL